jgi:hypothetical protein
MTSNGFTRYRIHWFVFVIGITCLLTGILEMLHRHLVQQDTFKVFNNTTWIAPKWFVFLLTGGENGLFKLLGFDGTPDTTVSLLLFLGFILLTQWLFLLPRHHWRVRLAESGRPMRTSVISAALLAALLSMGMGASLLDMSRTNWMEQIGNLPGFYTIILVLWGFWALVFYLHWRSKDRLSRLNWMLNSLITGTIMDLFVAIGVYAWNPQQDDCWCARGAYTGLVLGATVMIWLFGPGIILLFLHRQRGQQTRGQ